MTTNKISGEGNQSMMLKMYQSTLQTEANKVNVSN
jgi:hypothetical protein